MKTRIFAAILLLTMLSGGSSANAATTWYECKVLATGATVSETIYVQLTDTAATPAFEGKWFRMWTSTRKEMLALAITAITSDLPVQVRTDIDEPGAPFVDRFYLLAE